jgi:hypothetical protein
MANAADRTLPELLFNPQEPVLVAPHEIKKGSRTAKPD